MATILIIEDNNDIHDILKDLFETEHRVFSAYSGTEGLLLFAQEAIDLVLLDIMLPGKTVIRSWQKFAKTVRFQWSC